MINLIYMKQTLVNEACDFSGNKLESDPAVVSVAIVCSEVFDGVAEV